MISVLIFIRFNSPNKKELNDLFKIWEEIYPENPLPRRIKIRDNKIQDRDSTDSKDISPKESKEYTSFNSL